MALESEDLVLAQQAYPYRIHAKTGHRYLSWNINLCPTMITSLEGGSTYKGQVVDRRGLEESCALPCVHAYIPILVRGVGLRGTPLQHN